MLAIAGYIMIVPFLTPAYCDPVQWEANGHWYEVVLTGMPWPEARATADTMYWMGLRGHLATITSEGEQSWLWELVEPVFGNTIGVWLGGYQDPPESQPPDANWRWVTEEPWEYTNWAPGEPNDYQGPEWCLEFWELNLSHWNDQPDFRPNAFVVEYEGEVTAIQNISWGRLRGHFRNP